MVDSKERGVGVFIFLILAVLVVWLVGTGIYSFVQPNCNSWNVISVVKDIELRSIPGGSADIYNIEEVEIEKNSDEERMSKHMNMHSCKATIKVTHDSINISSEVEVAYLVIGKAFSLKVRRVYRKILEK